LKRTNLFVEGRRVSRKEAATEDRWTTRAFENIIALAARMMLHLAMEDRCTVYTR
jgi:hypothetical protein